MYTEKGSGYNHVVQNKYDEKNQLTQRNEIAGTMSAAEFYYYDDDNRVTDIVQGSIEESYTYDAFGRQNRRETRNGTTVVLTENLTFKTNSSGAPTAQVASLSSVASGYNGSLSYTYDDNGNILSVSDGTYTTTYVYDNANQLIRENNQAAGKTWTWTYDGAGNIQNRKEYSYTTGTLGAVQQQVNYLYGNSNWGDLLTSYNGAAITSDAIGNMLSDGTWSYTWQHGRELASMTDGSTTWSFTYNADGLRTGRSDGTTTYKYFYIDGKLSHMLIGSSYVHFAYDTSGVPIWMRYNGTRYYYVTNLQGDVIAILDSTGVPVVQYTYDAWGKVLSITGSMADTIGIINPLLYRGYIYDHDTGLYYLQSRYYNPVVGRFINADAFASTGQGILGNNMFAYCRNNPVKRKDVSGTEDVCVTDFNEDNNPLNDIGNPSGGGCGNVGGGGGRGLGVKTSYYTSQKVQAYDWKWQNSSYNQNSGFSNTAAGQQGTASNAFNSFIENPKSIVGKTEAEMGELLGEEWSHGTYGSNGTGWKYINGDKLVAYHPGGGRHGGSYYKLSSAAYGKIKVVGQGYIPIPGDSAVIIWCI